MLKQLWVTEYPPAMNHSEGDYFAWESKEKALQLAGTAATRPAVLYREVPAKPLHIEDLFTAVNNFQSAVRRSFRNVGTTEQVMKEEQAKLKEFFDSYGIEIDYSERQQ